MRSLRIWLRRLIYNLWKEQHQVAVAATYWSAVPCEYCYVMLPRGSAFCTTCGRTQQRETEAITRLSKEPTKKNLHIVTEMLRAYGAPGERPLDTYNRMISKKKETSKR